MDKAEILSIVNQKISDKVIYLEKLIAETRASSNDTKSSMGDKYETGREMLQQEINNLQIQLNEVIKQQLSLKNLTNKTAEKAEKGALVETDKGRFYISVSLGEIMVNNQKVFCISPESPLAKVIIDKKVKDTFVINNTKQEIKIIL